MKSKKIVFGAVGLTFLYGLFFYICASFLWSKGWFISLNDITPQNVGFKFFMDAVVNLSFVFVILGLIWMNKKSLAIVGITNQSRLVTLLLLAVYVIMFLAHGDFTIKGIYLAYFYLVVVAFAEEFMFRGFLFTQIEQQSNFLTGIVISGLLFGAMHSIMPTIISNGSFADLIAKISNDLLGQGILGSALFAFAYKKSGTLFVPVLIHAILDYSGVVFG
ncbi:hypothetical protein NRIC_09820 [Enterococcus florum]|uniref:CAAX prenyl protease 2/Lysostaphin resistance protein A-like domain-containing protein n=1 Tax=Enterococcus florum TaxID=2480627 RepID=A0A4P5PA43_9ENTE|nr:type II CAAX endopeptidase family protein [Enterococcus florum]GCF93091.1 hypothetical protein NRIC_09820 [Enterococcus florum]